MFCDLEKEASKVRMKININKTKTLSLMGHRIPFINGQNIEIVKQFVYLGTLVSPGFHQFMSTSLYRGILPSTIMNEEIHYHTDGSVRRQKWQWIGHKLRNGDNSIACNTMQWNLLSQDGLRRIVIPKGSRSTLPHWLMPYTLHGEI